MSAPERPEEEPTISETAHARSLPLFEGTADADAAVSVIAGAGEATPRADARITTPEFDRHFLALAQIRGAGIQALRTLIRYYGNLERVWEDDPRRITEVLSTAHVRGAGHIADAIKIEGRQLLLHGQRERERLARHGYRVIGADDPVFPPRLRERPDQPLWLFLEGDPTALSAPPLVAIVGTREASEQGMDTARHLTWLVIEAGLGIVSGLAEGIDRVAHQTAARHGARQVAVLGTGIEVMFPATNTELRRRIVESGGVIVTEYLPHEKYGKANFVQRNRIQAALAAAVCPVEGRAQSGTAHTIRFAREYERPLFGVCRGEPHPENELVASLRANAAPVFDLATQSGRQELHRFLDRIEGDRAPAPPPIDKQFWVRRALDKLVELQSYYDLTPEEKRRILDQVGRVIGLAPQQDEAGHDA